MKILVCSTPGDLQYQDKDIPSLKKGHSLIKIRRVGLCGTDLHAFEGTQPYFTYPRILGHELAAEYIMGDADGFIEGELVTIIPYFNCGECIACRTNKPNCCASIQVCGVHTDGAMAEYLLVPSYSLIHGNDLSIDELALVEPLAIGAHGIERACVKKGEHVLVIGAGPIGMGIMEFGRIAGGNVIALDINDKRLQFCKEKLGVEHIINGTKDNILNRLQEITKGEMPTVVVDATGSKNAINNAFQYLGHTGRYVLVGLQKEEICFSHPEFHKREATLMSSRNATRKNFEFVMNAMQNGLINPENYITHRVSFYNLAENFAQYIKPETGAIKVMTEF